jgi:hypothetical protein
VPPFVADLILVPALLIGLWALASLRFVYAAGERAGFIQKFSKKGWVFKTWEGELAMVNLPGAMPEIFSFTVRDDETAAKVQEQMGHRVKIHYEQHRALPGRVFGDTAYFVTQIEPVTSAATSPAPTHP